MKATISWGTQLDIGRPYQLGSQSALFWSKIIVLLRALNMYAITSSRAACATLKFPFDCPGLTLQVQFLQVAPRQNKF